MFLYTHVCLLLFVVVDNHFTELIMVAELWRFDVVRAERNYAKLL